MCVARFEGLGRARAGALVLAALIAACAAKEPTAAPPPAACKHPTPPKDPCQARWCDQPYGVGMPCTAKGGECKANDGKAGKDDLAAVLCTATFNDGSEAFCTMPCVADVQCGPGARCVGDPDNPNAGKGCMLTACAGDPKPADAGSTVDAGDATATADTVSPTDAK